MIKYYKVSIDSPKIFKYKKNAINYIKDYLLKKYPIKNHRFFTYRYKLNNKLVYIRGKYKIETKGRFVQLILKNAKARYVYYKQLVLPEVKVKGIPYSPPETIKELIKISKWEPIAKNNIPTIRYSYHKNKVGEYIIDEINIITETIKCEDD